MKQQQKRRLILFLVSCDFSATLKTIEKNTRALEDQIISNIAILRQQIMNISRTLEETYVEKI